MNNLWPSIAVIESNVKGSTASPLHLPSQFEADGSDGEPLIPPFIHDKIIRRVSARRADFGSIPVSGQIWRFDSNNSDHAPLCVLLDKINSAGRWHGWVVAPETDYATDQDVLLEPCDEPFDPIAAMVQTWNEIVVEISKANLVLAKLSSERMDAVREVARGEVLPKFPPDLDLSHPCELVLGQACFRVLAWETQQIPDLIIDKFISNLPQSSQPTMHLSPSRIMLFRLCLGLENSLNQLVGQLWHHS